MFMPLCRCDPPSSEFGFCSISPVISTKYKIFKENEMKIDVESRYKLELISLLLIFCFAKVTQGFFIVTKSRIFGQAGFLYDSKVCRLLLKCSKKL